MILPGRKEQKLQELNQYRQILFLGREKLVIIYCMLLAFRKIKVEDWSFCSLSFLFSLSIHLSWGHFYVQYLFCIILVIIKLPRRLEMQTRRNPVWLQWYELIAYQISSQNFLPFRSILAVKAFQYQPEHQLFCFQFHLSTLLLVPMKVWCLEDDLLVPAAW